ncbi:CDT1-like protein b [Arachis stenosperma]|uniref:CDT1-like protein b n=1 Tax=Arachis stenosperma TaxID=217475 RepID=UPI0025ACFFA6|nr:CDT1-like protein b [Arachis stenosperma]
MRSSLEASPSSSCRSKKHKDLSSKLVSSDSVSLNTKTPEKPPELTRHTRRTRNRGIALSLSEVRRVAKGLQEQRGPETTSFGDKSARRQIELRSPTKPQKTGSDEEEAFKLPEKYEILVEYFARLDCSIRLLRMKGMTPSFSKISHKIESLTDRRFTLGHLAQLKFVLPEAIVAKKVLVFDEKTSCMKPDLHVTINYDAVEYESKSPSEGGRGMLLRKLFRARLRDFVESHPGGDEIPEEVLPEPFNPKQHRLSDILTRPFSSKATISDADAAHPSTVSSAVIPDNDTEIDLLEPVRTSIESLNQQPSAASHVPQSFRRRFSQRLKENGTDNNALEKLPSDSLQTVVLPDSESSLSEKPTSEGASNEVCLTNCSSSGAPLATPCKTIEHTENNGSQKCFDAVSTPAKCISTPASITPALPTPPKRQFMSPEDNSSTTTNKLVRRPPPSLRSLKFETPVKNKEAEKEKFETPVKNKEAEEEYDDLLDVLPESLLQSIREKEIQAMEERDPAISQAKRRRKMIAGLPKIFNMIHLLLQSMNRSVITKEELVSKIISGNCDIVDRSEVEEQLNLLLELAPEWISEKLASSGDFLFCINKMVDAVTIRASLQEAK